MAKIIGLIILFFTSFATAAVAPWNTKLSQEISKILKSSDGQYGVFVRSMVSGEEFSWQATRSWYLASAIKLAVATELYHQVEQGKLGFDDTYAITSSDYRDGAGLTNFVKPGGLMTIRHLAEQMLVESDNAATDILIKKLGLDNVNSRLKEIVPTGFSPISTLLDVRRMAFSEFNPRALDLDNMDFMLLKKIKNESHKLRWFRRKLRLNKDQMNAKTLQDAYEKYYATEINSGSLVAYADLLAFTAKNDDLIAIMSRSSTGEKRLIKGLPVGYKFAHKTGTQLGRICDMGIVYKSNPKKGLIITVCAEKFKTPNTAEATFSKIAKAISGSGALKGLE